MSKIDRLTPEAAASKVTEAGPRTETPAQAASPAPKTGRKRRVFALIGLAVLAGAGWAGWEYWTVGRFMVSTDDAYVGADITLISSRVQGYVAEVPVEANQHVRAGEVLVQIDDGDYRIALRTAESRVATAGDTLLRIDAQIAAAEASVRQAEAEQAAAEATLRNAGLTLDRVKGLTTRNVAAQAQLDSATEAFDTATANLARAKAAVASAEAQVAVLKGQRVEAEGQRDELQLAVAQAQRNLDLTVLRAPSDGIIANLALEKGDLVSPGTRLAALVPDDGLYVEANFKETQMPGVRPGAKVMLTFDALPGQSFAGTVTSAAPATGAVFSLLPAENATGNFTKIVQRVPVRIAIPHDAQATGALRAGLSVVVEVDRRTGGADADDSAVRTSAAD